MLAAGPCELVLIEAASFGNFEVARKVGATASNLVCPVPNQKIIASSKGRSIRSETADCLVFKGFGKGVFDVIGDRKQKGFSSEIRLKVSFVLLEVLLPTQRCKSPYNFKVLSEAESECVGVGIASLMKVSHAEVVIACSEQQLEFDLMLEEAGQHIKRFYYCT